MAPYRYISFIIVLLGYITLNAYDAYGQSKTFNFGDISIEDLSNKPYKPDPGADAVILSETGVATLISEKGLYVELEKDVRIRIVNSGGYGFANIEIPYLRDDDMDFYQASTFNLRNGEKIETRIPKKSFIIEKSSPKYNTLKFNFQDVHEGSVIEYSYRIRLKNDAVVRLVPWEFQHEIPAVISSITLVYPDAFVYKSLISGSSLYVQTHFSTENTLFLGEGTTASIKTWAAANVPAFRPEPFILSQQEHLTRVTFELQRVDFPDISLPDISPTYDKLSSKLLDRWDFGIALDTRFKSLSDQVTGGSSDELTKLKKIHEYVSTKILWNGVNDFTTSSSLRNVIRKEKGNSADINIILIDMLRSAGIRAEPVILSTRSNGSLNEYSAMLQQFNYIVAAVTADRKLYLVDATDPLSPFDLLPFRCLNHRGRLISETESKFIDLKNIERYNESYSYDLKVNSSGNIEGSMESDFSDYSAHDIRNTVKMEGEDGYLDNVKSNSPTAEISDFEIKGLKDIDSDIKVNCKFRITGGAQVAGNKIVLTPFLSSVKYKNPFFSAERKFPVDLGCPYAESYIIRIKIPDGYSVEEKPADDTINLGRDDGKFAYSCKENGNEIVITSVFNLDKTVFQVSEYSLLRDFYLKVSRMKSGLILLKKNPDGI